MLSNPPNEFNNWSGKGVAEIILSLVAEHPKVRLFKRKPTSILNLTSLQLSNMEAPLERFKDLPEIFTQILIPFSLLTRRQDLPALKIGRRSWR